MDHLLDRDDIFVSERAQILDFSQGCQRETLVRHLVHEHVQFFQGKELRLARPRVFILRLVHLAKGALAYLFYFLEIAKSQFGRVSLAIFFLRVWLAGGQSLILCELLNASHDRQLRVGPRYGQIRIHSAVGGQSSH